MSIACLPDHVATKKQAAIAANCGAQLFEHLIQSVLESKSIRAELKPVLFRFRKRHPWGMAQLLHRSWARHQVARNLSSAATSLPQPWASAQATATSPGITRSLSGKSSAVPLIKHHEKKAWATEKDSRPTASSSLLGPLWGCWIGHVLASGPTWLWVALVLSHAYACA